MQTICLNNFATPLEISKRVLQSGTRLLRYKQNRSGNVVVSFIGNGFDTTGLTDLSAGYKSNNVNTDEEGYEE